MDIKSTKNAAGEIFLCFNEHSHNYKLFLNLIKSTESHPDTALRALAQNINKAIATNTVEDNRTSVRAGVSPTTSDGGLSHSLLTNITNKLDLLFNSIGSLKNNVPTEPIQHKLDTEELEVFGKRLEQSLGTLIATKLQNTSNAPILPENFAEQVSATLREAGTQCNINNIKPILSGLEAAIKKISEDIGHNSAQVVATLDKKSNEIQNAINKQNSAADLTNLANATKQLNDQLSKIKLESQSLPIPAIKTPPVAAKESPEPAPVEKPSDPSAYPGEDGVVRYPASKKKTQPSCFTMFSGDIENSPCPSCAWINDCKKSVKTAKKDKDKPDCFGKHKGDLDCSMCSFDLECNDIS